MSNMTTRKNIASRKIVTAKVKAPTKADMERRGKVALLSAANRKANANDLDALIVKACTAQGDATQNKLALGLGLNRMFQDECREMGVTHWSLATIDNCKGDNAKSLLQRIEFHVSEIRRVNQELVLKGKGDSNTNRLIGDIKRMAYEAVYGAKPRTPSGDTADDKARKAAMAGYKALMALDADMVSEDQLNTCRLFATILTAYKVDLSKINTKN
jgi:hypothetical protein